MFSSVTPPLDDGGSRCVVNMYTYAIMHFQVGCIRIRSLNTPQSDEMVERNKATFLRMEEYLYLFIIFLLFIHLFICPSSELMVVLLLCMLSV